ncbi:hypothetical protein AVEN_50915-1 [Araneus ventricosus]|uniref:Uncharacterized protein n=1 Tax=Araneus ventricosus TaxID=182803 RepID=A0A4Y2DYU1_ARAVE|nr:hypothetical protein AVEN_50915-1 [Araneus ventricosus]
MTFQPVEESLLARISKWRRQKDGKLETKLRREDATCKLREKSKQTNEESAVGKEWEAAGEEKECTEWKQGGELNKFEWKRVGSSWRRKGAHRVEARWRAEQIRVEKQPEWVEAKRELNKFEWKSSQNEWKP